MFKPILVTAILIIFTTNCSNGHFWSKFTAAIEARNHHIDAEIEAPFKHLKEGLLNEFPSLVAGIVDATNALNKLCEL